MRHQTLLHVHCVWGSNDCGTDGVRKMKSKLSSTRVIAGEESATIAIGIFGGSIC